MGRREIEIYSQRVLYFVYPFMKTDSVSACLTTVPITTVKSCIQGHYSIRRAIDFSYNSRHSSPRSFCIAVAAILVCHEPGSTHFCQLQSMLVSYSPYFKKFGKFSFFLQTSVTSNKHVQCTLLFYKPSV